MIKQGGTRIDYLIDGENRRVGKKLNGVLQQLWLYEDGLRPVAEQDTSGNVVSRFVYGSRSNVPDYMVKGGNTYRIVSDQLGSVRLVVNASSGAIAQSITYDPWGRDTADSSPGFQPFGFAGGLYDPDTKLVRFGARDYDASVGRWTCKDPVAPRSGLLNQYSYVEGDPLNFRDPSGLYFEYNQQTGDVYYVDDKTGNRTQVGKGYSGSGPGKNNPYLQDMSGVGPIPRGEYDIGPPVNRPGSTGPFSLPLTPVDSLAKSSGRGPFLIHGESKFGSPGNASEGCPILNPTIRRWIWNSGDRKWIVK